LKAYLFIKLFLKLHINIRLRFYCYYYYHFFRPLFTVPQIIGLISLLQCWTKKNFLKMCSTVSVEKWKWSKHFKMAKLIAKIILVCLNLIRFSYSSCPESYGVQTYPHEEYCDKFYLVSLFFYFQNEFWARQK